MHCQGSVSDLSPDNTTAGAENRIVPGWPLS